MTERLSLHSLGARLAPDLYTNRYLEHVAKECDVLLLPGELQARSLDSSYVTLRFREIPAGDVGTAPTEGTKTFDIWDALFRSPSVAIVGEPGSGKTTTLRYVALTLARRRMPEAYVRRLTFLHFGHASDSLFPVYADLGRWAPNTEDLLAFLGRSLAEFGFPAARDFLRSKFHQGGCILLLDGFEKLTGAADRAQFVELLAAYPLVQAVVATRTPDGLENSSALSGLECLPISEADSAAFVSHRFDKDPGLASALLQALERNAGLRSLAGNPLLLGAMARASAQSRSSPLHLRILYDQCVQTLAGDKDARTQQRAAAPFPSAMDQALPEVALCLHERRLHRFDDQTLEKTLESVLERLGRLGEAQSWLRQLRDGLFMRVPTPGTRSFLRPSVQEYLAARAVVAKDGLQQVLAHHVDDEWWSGVIVCAAALYGDSAHVVDYVLSHGRERNHALPLAARCAFESTNTPSQVKNRLRDELLALFEYEDAGRWREAAVCIAALQGQRVTEFFPRALREGPEHERQRAARVMGRIGTSEWSTVALLGALDRKSPLAVRRQAAWALGQLRDKRAVQALMTALKDEPELAMDAAMALSVIGEPAVPALTAALSSDDPQVRQMAIKALGKMGTTVLRPLLSIVRDEKQTEQVIRGAAEALGLLGDPQAIPDLVALLGSRRGRNPEPVANALAAIGAPAVQSLVDALPAHGAELELRQAIVSGLVTIGAPSIPALLAALDSASTAVRSATEDALTRIGPPAIEALLKALGSGDLNVRRRIAEILERIGDERIADPLVRMLTDKDQDPGVRVRVMHILGQIGYEKAVEPLIETMQKDPEELVRREAVRTLMDLKSERAVAPLIDMLQDNELRDYASTALVAIGEPAVEPLILAISEGRNTGLVPPAVKALGGIGSRGRLGEPTLSALARVYSQLFASQPDLPELIALLENIRWWRYGEELYQVFASAQALLQTQDLEDVAECPEKLAWADALETPFRRPLKHVLRDLSNVAQSVHVYLQDFRRAGQRDAMLSAIDTLTSTQEAIDSQLLEFEKKPFAAVVALWRQLTEDAIKSLRGRAQLELMLMRDDLPLESASSTATLIFRLTNVGDSAARNLRVTLKRGGMDGFEIIGPTTQELDPLGSGMQREVQFTIKPLTGTEAAFAFEVTYDDDEGADRFYPISGRVRFFELDRRYRPIPSSPYNWGPPVKTSQMFYGRQDVFDWIDRNLSCTDDPSILILHGERRMGKTSVLYQLRTRPPTPQHMCVFFSLELATTASLGDLFFDMAVAIRDELLRLGLDVPEPAERDIIANPQRSFRHFLDSLEAPLGDRRLLVMIDEIDILIAKVEAGVLSADALHFLRGLMQHTNRIAFICTGAYKVREMLKDNQSILFNTSRTYKVSYLNQSEAVDLITKPVEGYLFYDDLVVQKILEVTACHPYFVQYICDLLVKTAQRTKTNQVFRPDIDVVLQEIIQDNAGVLQNSVYAPLSGPEQRVLAALANVTTEQRVYVPPGMVADKLNDHKLGIPKQELLNALRSLRERDLVVEQRAGQSLTYGFKMGLIRMWLCQNDVLLRLSQEMKI
jgi:HEAT repeat protein